MAHVPESIAQLAPPTETGTCQCRLTPGGTIVCPACAERQLLALLVTAPNPPVSREEQATLYEKVNTWFDSLQQQAHPGRSGSC